MRILFVTTTLGTRGGIQRVTTVKANCFAEMPGNEVAISFTDRLGWPENSIHPLSPKVKVFDLDSPFWDREPKRFDIFWRIPRKAFVLRSKILDVINSFNPDVVISTGQFEKYVLPFVKPFNRNFILIREYHFASNYRQIEQMVRFGRTTWKPRLINYFENKLLSRLFDSNFLLTKQDKEENALNGHRFDYMWNPTSFDIADSNIVVKKEKIVLAAGRLTKQKNFSDLIHIWNKTQHDNWKLRIIGEGEDKETLRLLTIKYDLTDSVEIVGFSNDVKTQMQKASIFVGSSTFEGCMLVLVEAMSQACVPISYRTPYGPAEIITHGEDGFLTEMHDVDIFASHLTDLIADTELREKMALNALQRAKTFDVNEICSEWIKKYDNLYTRKFKRSLTELS